MHPDVAHGDAHSDFVMVSGSNMPVHGLSGENLLDWSSAYDQVGEEWAAYCLYYAESSVHGDNPPFVADFWDAFEGRFANEREFCEKSADLMLAGTLEDYDIMDWGAEKFADTHYFIDNGDATFVFRMN